MSFTDVVLVYLLWWWLILFAVLPWRVSAPKFTEKGHDLGAPENPRLGQKFAVTSSLAAVATFLFWLAIPSDVGERGGVIAVLGGFG